MSLVPSPSPHTPDDVIHLKTQLFPTVPRCATSMQSPTHLVSECASLFRQLISRCLQPRLCLLQVSAGAGTPHGGEYRYLGCVRHRVPLRSRPLLSLHHLCQ